MNTTFGKRSALLAITLVLGIAFCLCLARPAYATAPSCDTWGATKTFTYGSVTVSHQSGLELTDWGDDAVYVTGWAYAKSANSVPANTFGALARIYNKAGLVLNSTKRIWNATGETDFGVGAATKVTAGQGYYSGGSISISQTHINYQECAYSATRTYRSSSYNSVIHATEYATNASGESYGSLISAEFIGYTPDLIAVQATNGNAGYMFSTDYENAANNLSDNSTVAVYDKEGTTIIGEFAFSEAQQS